MKVRLALIKQHIEQAQTQAKELAVLCEQVKEQEKIDRAFDIEMGLEWTGRRVNDFDAALSL